jgi:mevalonate kinase
MGFERFPADRTLLLPFQFNMTSGCIIRSAALSVRVAAAARRALYETIDTVNLFRDVPKLEMFFHSNSLGFDIASVLQGAAIRFPRCKEIQRMAIPHCSLLIVDSGRSRQTQTAVNDVRDLLLRHGEKYSAARQTCTGSCNAAGRDKRPFLTANFPVAESLLEELYLG